MVDERLLVSIPRHVLHTPFQLHQGLHFTRIRKPFTWPYCWPTRCFRNNTYKAFIHSHNNILISTSEKQVQVIPLVTPFPVKRANSYVRRRRCRAPAYHMISLVKFDSKAPLKKPRNHSMNIWRGLRRFPRLTMGLGLNEWATTHLKHWHERATTVEGIMTILATMRRFWRRRGICLSRLQRLIFDSTSSTRASQPLLLDTRHANQMTHLQFKRK